MVKYKSELKAQIVHEYLSTSQSAYDLSKKYQINRREIAKWVQRYRLNGINGLKRRRQKRTFTTDFKLNVIDYYQTHEDSMAEVAARFDILAAQVSAWRTQFKRDGITALKPHPKGRPSKVKRTKKQIRQLANKSEVEQLKEELAKKNQELYNTKLERDLLKKSLSLFGPSKPGRKPK
ncbi:helix-turn-helix domain-containing protein [Limosilactobacillus reuteri]|uniref:Transposase n=1 Tax=Limosilactobacillus reuteri TaxID=1598 RepID=A0A2S1ER11_LIMRT|nr:helix-turn-helix domain-containing protein [Limosilactobacillus reuteri]AWD62238.1 transposase [Limosilactobacillus reuteri]AWD62424.1 transposase [Limosilactobacillus reuteri]AWD62788.1 transposase [Limosilactobacillus reuteri]AWD63310.1 transposase [Limosilactobacillus reuteri]AWD63465.1 transposase [Limosilactobacillus reuteri]